VGDGVTFEVANWTACASVDDLDHWSTLADRAPLANPFFEHWCLLPALAHLHAAGRVHLARLWRGGGLDGLMPLVRARRYGRHPLPHLAGWLHANCFLGAPLVAAGAEETFWQALLDWADAHAGAALFLHIAALPLDTPLAEALSAVAARDGRRIALVHREDRALLQADLTPEAYLAAAVSGKKRKEYRRQHARLAELGALRALRTRDADGAAEWIERFLALEAQGWKGRAGSALASSPGTGAFAREALGEAARLGRLDRVSLELDGAPVAMLATLLAGDGAFSFKTAFDEAYARFSPGVLLQLENLALLDDPALAWCDSCAAADHPMIDSLWRERRPIGRFSVAIGGRGRRAVFDRLLTMELNRNPVGIR
jgi:CelD/BcsL family acetyltransferase involved in cellulose biosynthesis